MALKASQVRMAQAALRNREAGVAEVCRELGIGRSTLYRYVGPGGELRDQGMRALNGDVR